MNCPACGVDGSSVLKSIDNGPDVQRRRACQCGARWTTDEMYRKGTLATISGQERPLKASVGPPLASNQPPVAPNGRGGVGGGVSSGLDSGPDPIPLSVPSQQSGARARVSNTYSPAFEAFWAATWKAGAKGDAQKAWREQGQPTADGSAPAIAAYLAAKKASGQSLQNVGVWLRAGGARQTEWHLVPIGKPNAQPPQRPAPYHAPVREPGWMSAPPPKPWPKREERSDDTLTPPDWMGLDEKLAEAKGTG